MRREPNNNFIIGIRQSGYRGLQLWSIFILAPTVGARRSDEKRNVRVVSGCLVWSGLVLWARIQSENASASPGGGAATLLLVECTFLLDFLALLKFCGGANQPKCIQPCLASLYLGVCYVCLSRLAAIGYFFFMFEATLAIDSA